MGRMDNAKSEETRPVPTGDETRPVSTGDETRETQLDQETRQVPTRDETHPISLGDETRSIQAGEDTRQIQTGGEDRPISTGDETRQVQFEREPQHNPNADDTMAVLMGDETKSIHVGKGTQSGAEDETVAVHTGSVSEESEIEGQISSPVDAEHRREVSPSEETETEGQSLSPEEVKSEGQSPAPTAKPRERSRRMRLIFLAIAGLLLVAVLSAWGGYQSGISQRLDLEAAMIADAARQQYNLGLEDVEAGRYEVARQRFEYVINIDPGYPGVTEQLAQVLLAMNTTATPTPAPTPTLTPTPDLRGEEKIEELFLEARAFLLDRMWTEAIDTLLTLRKEAPDYQAVKVDGMLYTALRNRGVHRILNEGDLESGSYDLALAEGFGPIDVEADSYRQWAEWYGTGMSFWELDWGEASNYFGLLVQVAPNLRDASNITATERFRVSALHHADFLAANGHYCAAQEKYQAVLNLGANPLVEPTANWAGRLCAEGESVTEEPPPQQPPAETATPTPGEETATPTPEPIDTEPYPSP